MAGGWGAALEEPEDLPQAPVSPTPGLQTAFAAQRAPAMTGHSFTRLLNGGW